MASITLPFKLLTAYVLKRIFLSTVLFTLVALEEAHGMEKVYALPGEENPLYRLLTDTLKPIVPDSASVDTLAAKTPKDALEAKVEYHARDLNLEC